MRGKAMRKVLDKLTKRGINLSNLCALEVFAREGNWHAKIYSNRVKQIEAWEIDKEFKKGLVKNLPKAKIKITDSIKEISKKSNFSKYDFIVVDNPQACYGPKQKHCEHFQVIPKISKLLKERGVIIFNINKQPFNYSSQPNWRRRREIFYKTKKTDKLAVGWLKRFYKNIFSGYGYRTVFCFNIVRGVPSRNNYLHYLVYYLEKK